MKESCSSSSTSSNNISLKNTRGPPTRLEVSPKKKPDKGISIDDLKNWMKKEGMCLAHLRRNGKLIRKHFGKKSIEKYAREALKQDTAGSWVYKMCPSNPIILANTAWNQL